MHLVVLCDSRDREMYKDTLEDVDVKMNALGGSKVNRVIPCAHCHQTLFLPSPREWALALSPFKIFESNNLNKPNISE